jgi:hypothetical protein
MKRLSILVLSLLAVPQLFADTGGRLIPAGALVSCTTGDGKISSKTSNVGDPILCKVKYRHGDFTLPYGSYLGGEFSEYKDPGHFVGKGWMLLEFDRLYVGNQVIPMDAKVVDVPGYKIGQDGRILGKGHAVRDTVLWMIPVLWPIDLINLPRRGPKPTLKAETSLTLRVMSDIEVPDVQAPQRDPYGLVPRGNQGYAPAPPAPTDDQQQAAPQMSYDQQPAPVQEPIAPPAMSYAAPVPYPYAVAPPVMAYGGVGVGIYVGPRPAAYGYAPRATAYGYAPRGYATQPIYVPRGVTPRYGVGVGVGVRGMAGRSGGMAARGGSRR